MTAPSTRRAAPTRLLLPVAVLVVLVGLAVVAASRAGGAGEPAAASGPGGATENREVERMMAEQSAARAEAGGPPLLLPEDQRAGWIEAWNRLRDCASGHGFDGVPAVSPTFGDGRTPAPVIRMVPGADRALANCPFDESLFDRERVAAAVAAQAPEGTQGP